MLFINLHKNSKAFGSDQINHEYINDIFLLNNSDYFTFQGFFQHAVSYLY